MDGDKTQTSKEEFADRAGGEAMRLDGNSAAGILSEVFALDMTTARAQCANCDTVCPLGALPLYGQSMGAVMRCPTCDAVVLRAVRTPGRLWLDATGARLLLMADVALPGE
jgi:Family of unknown function (DUF6510)